MRNAILIDTSAYSTGRSKITQSANFCVGA